MNRYYVKINGVSSLTIPGLAIKELPSISKTLMRNQREEVDGRDGDIITNLGYSAYDKTLVIGLYGSYDIDKIIAFFNQKGTIVFSDEADKYYNFTILDRIDYAKLVKFRTASIKIHCQPFKYELNETPKTIEAEYIEVSGTEATINNTAEAPLEIGLKGNAYQETTTGQQLYDVFDTLVFGDIVSLDGDGWITISYDNTSGSSTKFSDFKTKTSNKVQTGQTYKLVLEIKSVTGSGNLNFAMNQPISQTETSVTYNLNALSVGTSVHDITMKSDFTGCTSLLNSYCSFPAGQSGSITFRMSVLADLSVTPQTFTYEPYTNGASPNPDYPQAVEVVTGDNTINIVGKNLLNATTNSVTNPANENTINTIGTLSLTAGTTYYISYNVNNSSSTNTRNTPRLVIQGTSTVFYESTSTNYNLTTGRKVWTFNCQTTDTYKLEYWCNNPNTAITVDNFMISTSNDTLYTPYQSQVYPINLGTLELCKIGTYQDYPYKSGDNWYKHKEIGKITLDGTEDITQNSNTSYSNTILRFTISVSDKKLSASNTEADNIKCNMFTSRALNFDARTQESIAGHDSNHAIIIFIDSSRLSSADTTGFKAWLSSNTPVVYYILETPTEEQITDEALITQLNALQNAMSYLDQTNVTQTYDNMPFILDLKAIKKGTNEITINNTGNIYSKPIMALNGSGTIKININNTEVLRIDMSEHHNITIDSANMEAYDPNTMALRNRQVTGSYENLKLQPGNNKVLLKGKIIEATITYYKRWL